MKFLLLLILFSVSNIFGETFGTIGYTSNERFIAGVETTSDIGFRVYIISKFSQVSYETKRLNDIPVETGERVVGFGTTVLYGINSWIHVGAGITCYSINTYEKYVFEGTPYNVSIADESRIGFAYTVSLQMDSDIALIYDGNTAEDLFCFSIGIRLF